MPTAYLGLGSNLGDRRAHLRNAIDRLNAHPDLAGGAVSPVYETEAHTIDADTTQPPFLNAVMEVRTLRGPEALLSIGKALEHDAGRSPTDRRWAPRPLDIDILTYNHCTRSSATLTLPHPRLAERRFVLRPWADIAPNLQIPAPFDASVRALLARCPDASSIRRVGPAR